MKKVIFIIIISISFLFDLRSQNCTNCSLGNLINSTNYSSALGIDNKSWGLGSLAAGKYDTVTGNYSVGFGFRAIVTGETSFAAGGIVKSSGLGSMSFGHYLHASGTKAFIIGTGGSSTGILTNDIENSLKVGFGSIKSTLFVSPAPANGKTGDIGIGDVTSPSAKLHIKSDYGEDAALLLEPNQWNSDGWAEIQVGNNANAMRGSYTYGLQFKTDKNYLRVCHHLQSAGC